MTDDSKIYSECQAERSASEIQQKIDMVLRAEDLHNIPEVQQKRLDPVENCPCSSADHSQLEILFKEVAP